MAKTLEIEVCSCEQSDFYRRALNSIVRFASENTHQSNWADLRYIQGRALQTLSVREPGGEPPCNCEESLHLARTLRTCANLAADGEGGKAEQPIHDLAQCHNVARQGLDLKEIEGDPGVYDCARFIPGTIENARWCLEVK